MTNIEHRIQKLNQVIPPQGTSMPDWGILEEVAKRLGRPMGFFNVSDIFREMTLTIPFYRGLRLRDLAGDGKISPPFSEAAPINRTGRSYSFAPVRTWEAPEPEHAAQYPFEMMAGRSMYHFGSVSTRSQNLLTLCPEGYVEINPLDAEELRVTEGENIEVSSPVGSFVAPAKMSDKIERGMVFVPTNFPGLAVYKLFEENTNVCRVKLRPLGGNSTP